MNLINFVRCSREPCFYYLTQNGLTVIVIVYVDDILVSGNDHTLVKKCCEKLEEKFVVRCLGYPSTFLVIQISKPSSGKFVLSQSKKIKSMLEELGVKASKSSCLSPIIPLANH